MAISSWYWNDLWRDDQMTWLPGWPIFNSDIILL